MQLPQRALTTLCVHAQSLSWVQLLVTPWAVAHQAPLSMELSRQEYQSGLPFPPPGDLLNPGSGPHLCVAGRLPLGSPSLQPGGDPNPEGRADFPDLYGVSV